MMRLEELTDLARRDRRFLRRYGDKQVARLLQVRLAQVLSSLGFFVVESRTGERAVDLICISAQPGESQTLLVEAKSTAGRYNLPVDDARALFEYATEVRRRLAGISPPSCIVVMSHAASAKLPERLKRLQADLGVPVRFWSTQDLADLRENLTGFLPVVDLIDYLRRSDFVIPRGQSARLVTGIERRHTAYCEMVRAQMNLPAVRTTKSLAWKACTL